MGNSSARRLGAAGVCTKVLASCPAIVSGPRGLWYLKDREITHCPLATKAEATVSPSSAGSSRPSKRALTAASRLMRLP